MRKRIWIYIGLCAAAAAAAIVAYLIAGARGDATGWLQSERGPIQITQSIVLTAACALMLWLLLRHGLRQPESPANVGLFFLTFFLAWREIELDGQLWGVHAFSWKYLWGGDEHDGRPIPWSIRLALGAPSLALTAWTAAMLAPRLDGLWAGLRHRWPRGLLGLLIDGAAMLVLSQVWDKSRTLERHLSFSLLHDDQADPFPEELLELLGEMLILCFAVEYACWRQTAAALLPVTAREHARAARAQPAANPPP